MRNGEDGTRERMLKNCWYPSLCWEHLDGWVGSFGNIGNAERDRGLWEVIIFFII